MPSAEPMEEEKDICTKSGFVWVENVPPPEKCSQPSGQPSMFMEGVCYGRAVAYSVQPVVDTTMNAAAMTAGVFAGLTTNLAWGIVSNFPAASKALYKGFTNTIT